MAAALLATGAALLAKEGFDPLLKLLTLLMFR